MTSNDGAHVVVRGSARGSVRGVLRRGRGGPIALGLVLAAAALAGCSMSDGIGPYIVDPGRYSVYHCKDLVALLEELLAQEKELRNLMDKASEGGGGTVIGALSYRADYEKALGEEAALRRTAAEKKCELGPPTYQSDQTIR
jgi:hypothetical protein